MSLHVCTILLNQQFLIVVLIFKTTTSRLFDGSLLEFKCVFSLLFLCAGSEAVREEGREETTASS